MKRHLIFIAGLLVMFSVTVGQDRGQRRRDFQEKMKAEKVSFFTDKLDLTVEESKVFWPLFDEYEKKKDEISRSRRNEMRKLFGRENRENRENNEISDKDTEKLADSFVMSKVKEANLLKTYHTKFKEILPIKKVMLLYHVEESYKSHLLNQIRGQRKDGRDNGGKNNNQK